MAALPFVFLTNELHVLPLATLQNGQAPPSIQITKNFIQSQLDDINREFSEVKSMGPATAEEWLKGLDDRGKARRSDAIRWERWEASGGVARMQTAEPQEASKVTTQLTIPTPVTAMLGSGIGSAATNSHFPAFQDYNSTQTPTQALPQLSTHTFPTSHPRFDSPSQIGFPTHLPRAHPQPRHERTKEEVAELKAARKAEIERRSLLLHPPLTSGVLAHMPSFQAAIQIIQPLDDGAWQVLEPRLISQRQDAEQRESERLAQTRVVQERFDFQDVEPRPESKDLDREWEDIQAPLRVRIGGYADETIRDAWAGGNKVTKDNCPAFAAEVLVYVRKRFYAEVAKDEAAIRANGREPNVDPPGGPYTRKLTLENMKWVFDTKIKPHTEQYRKELFLCSECENHFKFYGFEGVIQHYAAKHTNDLSVGSIVVHWKAEWPEYPPFNPEPLSSKPPYYAAVLNAASPYPVTGPPQSYGYGGYQPAPAAAPAPASNPNGYQENLGPYYGHPPYGDQYPGHQNGSYAPPQAYPEAPPGYQPPQYSAPPPVGNNPVYSEPLQDYSQQSFGGHYPATTQGYYAPQHAGPYPVSGPEAIAQRSPYAPQGGQYGYPYSLPPAQAPMPFESAPTPASPSAPQKTEEYKAQLQDVAKNARDVWDSINNIKDIPGSVKVYAIIYHVLRRSQANFPEEPPLSMIIDGLSNNKNMRKVRNINGLLCKACRLGMAGSSSALQKKHFSFPQLTNHFYSVHEQGAQQNNIPDWTKDMIDLPDLSRLASALRKPGIGEQKLKLIGEALPEIFAAPQQGIEDSPTAQGQPRMDQDQYELAPSRDNHERYYSSLDGGKQPESDSRAHDGGQYDPRNPYDPRPMQAPDDLQPAYKVLRRAEDYYPESYQTPPERSYLEPRAVSPPHGRSSGVYSHGIIREDAPSRPSQERRHGNEGGVEYRVRREAAPYDDVGSGRPEVDYRPTYSYRASRPDIPSSTLQEVPPREARYLPAEDAVAQQNRVFEVVAQITQQAKQARERKPATQPMDGSEDIGLQARPTSRLTDNDTTRGLATEASNAADRFLNELQPGQALDESEDLEQDGYSPSLGTDRVDSIQHVYQPQAEGRALAGRGRAILESGPHNGYTVRGRSPHTRQSPYPYDDRYANPAPEHAVARERSPELVDRRFKLNNVVYRDERQSSHGMRRTPSQYARYESVRLENERARSRSPVYVKMGTQPGHYRERSPAAHHTPQEALYGARAALPPADNIAYERAPRQEYYRVYADEPRRPPQYVDSYEYVQVSDAQGDYMIRRPVRREREPEPVYAAYEDEPYRQPVYESRAAVSRSDPAYYEEYDPRHPAPPPAAARPRYQ